MDHWLYFRVRVLLLLQSVNTLESSSKVQVHGTDNVDDWVCSERSGVTVAVFAIIRMRVRWPEGVGAPLILDFAKIYWWYATVMSGLRFGGCMRDAVEKLGTFAGCVRLCMGRVYVHARRRLPIRILIFSKSPPHANDKANAFKATAMYDDSR